MDRILAVVPVRNRKATTRQALANLRVTLRRDFVLDILVIDDGSDDGTAGMLSVEFPEVAVIQGDGQLWWGGALNIGFNYAVKCGYKYVYVMNDDVELRLDAIVELHDAARKYSGAVCGSLVIYENARVLSAEFGFRGLLGKVHSLSNGRSIESISEEIIDSETLSTRSTLIPCEILQRGLFVDVKRFPHHFSDYDYFDRVRRAGFRILVVTRSVATSDMSSSSFHRLIASSSVGAVLSTFSDIKYANNVWTQWHMASKHASLPWAIFRFIGFMMPYAYWLTMRIILPREYLVRLLGHVGRHPMLGRHSKIAREVEPKVDF